MRINRPDWEARSPQPLPRQPGNPSLPICAHTGTASSWHRGAAPGRVVSALQASLKASGDPRHLTLCSPSRRAPHGASHASRRLLGPSSCTLSSILWVRPSIDKPGSGVSGRDTAHQPLPPLLPRPGSCLTPDTFGIRGAVAGGPQSLLIRSSCLPGALKSQPPSIAWEVSDKVTGQRMRREKPGRVPREREPHVQRPCGRNTQNMVLRKFPGPRFPQ